MNKSKWTQRK